MSTKRGIAFDLTRRDILERLKSEYNVQNLNGRLMRGALTVNAEVRSVCVLCVFCVLVDRRTNRSISTDLVAPGYNPRRDVCEVTSLRVARRSFF